MFFQKSSVRDTETISFCLFECRYADTLNTRTFSKCMRCPKSPLTITTTSTPYFFASHTVRCTCSTKRGVRRRVPYGTSTKSASSIQLTNTKLGPACRNGSEGGASHMRAKKTFTDCVRFALIKLEQKLFFACHVRLCSSHICCAQVSAR